MEKQSCDAEAMLEYLRSACGCTFLSDLHSSLWNECLIQAVKEAEADGYSLHQWQSAYQYLTGENTAGGTAAQMKQKLIDYLVSQTF